MYQYLDSLCATMIYNIRPLEPELCMSKNCILSKTLLEFLLSRLFSRLDIDTCGTDTSEPSIFKIGRRLLWHRPR